MNHSKVMKVASRAKRSEKKAPIAWRSGEYLLMEAQGEGESVDFHAPGSVMKNAGMRLPAGAQPGGTYSHYTWIDGYNAEKRDEAFAIVHVGGNHITPVYI
jgi:hypothetical protein